MDELTSYISPALLDGDSTARIGVEHRNNDYATPPTDAFVVILGEQCASLNEGQLRVLRDRIDRALAAQQVAIGLREEWHEDRRRVGSPR